jgi:hypothetical protein
MKEIPFEFGERSRGSSKASFKVAVDYALLLLRLYASKYKLNVRSDRLNSIEVPANSVVDGGKFMILSPGQEAASEL